MPTSDSSRLHRDVQRYIDAVRNEDDSREIQLLGTGAVEELETKLCQLVGMRYAVCVSSGTTGLLVAALALGLRNKPFVTTPLTYGGSIAGWLALGNTPRFADVTPDTLSLDPESVRRRVRGARGAAAILAVDLHGVPGDTGALRSVADELGVPYVADAAQSLGAYVRGTHASSKADIVVTSFTSGKSLFAGEGGAVLTNDRETYEQLLWHGQHPYRQRFQLGLSEWNECGMNARIHPLAAVWANASLDPSMRAQAERRRRARVAVLTLATKGVADAGVWANQDVEPAVFRVSATFTGQDRDVAHSQASQSAPELLPERPLALLSSRPELSGLLTASDRSARHCPVAIEQARRRLVWRLAGKRSARPSAKSLR